MQGKMRLGNSISMGMTTARQSYLQTVLHRDIAKHVVMELDVVDHELMIPFPRGKRPTSSHNCKRGQRISAQSLRWADPGSRVHNVTELFCPDMDFFL